MEIAKLEIILKFLNQSSTLSSGQFPSKSLVSFKQTTKTPHNTDLLTQLLNTANTDTLCTLSEIQSEDNQGH